MNLGTKVFLLVSIVMTLTFPSGMQAQWNKKPHAEWSVRDAQKLLDDSPWGKTDVFTDPSAMFGRPPNERQPSQAGPTQAQNSTHVNFRIRFLSAKPIRQAISRLLELKNKGGMNSEFESVLNTFTTGEFYDYVVVVVTCDSSERGPNFQQANGLLHSRGTADLQHSTFLEVRGAGRVFLKEYQTPRQDGLGARFLFPRLLDGKPYITLDRGEIHLYSELSSTYRLDKRFKIKDMVYEGKLEY